MNVKEVTSETMDTASTTTEDSTAIVSLYNSWTTSDCGSLPDEEPHDIRPHVSNQNILEQLKKRCREEDLPAELKLRPRKRPNCVFLNYLGRSRATPRIRPSKIASADTSPTAGATTDDLDPCSLLICGTQLLPMDSLDFECLEAVFDDL
ncbi:hypothetical protein FisN_15Hu322 [Fistulifera solaris]|jgi:hypothetical protein|uniref:Uncharacterized protein n=1 Tax=Fistulifera solaris TaxID=1519565 RepID=A0A1Z5JGG0_FISSO|nr:hypothetical protein FisN_15Hu322 [Fistulifera solaris]|eukprot:GAX12841.1 hypothetical protein FisN_15Hu322 [Fistulifera solaris]